jgi:hypothetical protein
MTVEMKPLPNDLIDALLADYKKPEDLIGGVDKITKKTKITPKKESNHVFSLRDGLPIDNLRAHRPSGFELEDGA